MDKREHGKRLKTAIDASDYSRDDVALVVGRSTRTVTNWTSGATMPSESERAALRKMLGDYDAAGDPVEVAIFGSGLTKDRQYMVIGFYQRQLREQAAERAG